MLGCKWLIIARVLEVIDRLIALRLLKGLLKGIGLLRGRLLRV